MKSMIDAIRHNTEEKVSAYLGIMEKCKSRGVELAVSKGFSEELGYFIAGIATSDMWQDIKQGIAYNRFTPEECLDAYLLLAIKNHAKDEKVEKVGPTAIAMVDAAGPFPMQSLVDRLTLESGVNCDWGYAGGRGIIKCDSDAFRVSNKLKDILESHEQKGLHSAIVYIGGYDTNYEAHSWKGKSNE